MRKLNDKLFENFEDDKVSDMTSIYGGTNKTRKKDDCMNTSYDDDFANPTRWGKDSVDGADTGRSEDGCNPPALAIQQSL